MAGVVIAVDFQRQAADAALARVTDVRPVLEQWPALFRTGPDGVAHQIATRTYRGPRGESRPWVEPPYVTGGLPTRSVESERVLWDAARGAGPAAFDIVGPDIAGIGVDDSIIGALAAQLGNRVVPPVEAAYFRTVTGGWDARQTPVNVVPFKPAVIARGKKAPAGAEKSSSFKPKNATAVTVKYAMWWYLGLTYNYWLTEAELLAGVPTPPKNIGISRRVIEMAKDMTATWIATGRLERAA